MENGRKKHPEVRERKRREIGLKGKSKEELISIIFRLEARLNRLESSMAVDETQVLATSKSYAPNLATLSFRTYPGEVSYLRLPASPVRHTDNLPATTWRVVLVSSDPRHKPLGLEIYDDVIVGRKVLGARMGLDLTDYHAEVLGVSRRHALLRPSKRSLFLIDLGSSNGTFCNAVRLGVGEAHRLTEKDIVSFGKLHFRFSDFVPPSRG